MLTAIRSISDEVANTQDVAFLTIDAKTRCRTIL